MSHLYCIVQQKTKESIFRVGIANEEQTDKQIETFEIFDSLSKRILAIEADPENSDNLFLVDDDEKILTLQDKSDGQKADIKDVFDMSVHSL